jgi:hypothetical protein
MQLKAVLPDFAVTNYAADGFTSGDVLAGAVPKISFVKRDAVGDPFPDLGEDRVFKPLELLCSMRPAPSHAVLSVGGNDVRHILGNMGRLPEVMASFRSNYAAILERLRATVPKVILMFQYRPGFHLDDEGYGVYQAMSTVPGPGSAVAKINWLMETIFSPVIQTASQMQFPVVDLPRSFDIYDDELFCCQIEPSAKGGALIANMLSHVIRCHDFSGPSKFYLSRDDTISALDNSTDCRWSIED